MAEESFEGFHKGFDQSEGRLPCVSALMVDSLEYIIYN